LYRNCCRTAADGDSARPIIIHIGSAVAAEGLIVPISPADQKISFANCYRSKDHTARQKIKITTNRIYRKYVYNSNLGMDIEEFTAIINPPDTYTSS
jgi:hypothetical protein